MEKRLQEVLEKRFHKTLDTCTKEELFHALMEITKEATGNLKRNEGSKKLYYISAEFLIGKLLSNNLINLGLYEETEKVLKSHGYELCEIEELEMEPSLGNGGLGRLAACFLDSIATLGLPGDGIGLNYHFGLFQQKFTNHKQQELKNPWITKESWLNRQSFTCKVQFKDFTMDGVLYDIDVPGYDSGCNRLHLFDVDTIDESIVPENSINFNKKKVQKNLTLFLYPDDSDDAGRKLRIYQQYFMVSNAAQLILAEMKEKKFDLRKMYDHAVIQINDTHPALVIPELMRILMDDAGFDWDTAWNITKNSVAYTNHTVLAEALERWPQQLMEMLLPRVWEIITEIAHRYQKQIENFYHDPAKTAELAIVWDGQVRMANLCIAGGMAVNGVSALHSDILRHDVFRWQYQMEPEKFKNVTNGIDHRRWLAQINPRLDGLIADLCGGRGYLLHPEELKKLEAFAGDGAVLARLDEIKRANKLDFAAYVKKTQGVTLNTDAIFDVQVKRLHEYKRQLLNAMHIIYLYQKLQDDPSMELQPRTFLFGAKAAPGYAVAKRIIHLINSLANQINSDPLCRGRLQVVFLENYRVSLAEHLMPASEVSQQISTAGKEASGTGNMKFMMNGALTVGTLDGANVEMHEVLGDENMFLFGLHADEVARLKAQGYAPQRLCERDDALKRVVDQLRTGFSDGVSYDDLAQRLLQRDEYMLLQDFASYCAAEQRMAKTYADRAAWDRMSLLNIARSGIFAADRAVAQYADNIWHVPHK